MKTKLVIAGIGGVGGYFGGLLARHFENSAHVQISFVARGQHLTEIQQHGLKVIQGDNSFVARPALATDKPAEIGVADYVVVATKSFGLEAMIEQLRPCIGENTVILPLLNGVDSRERIQQLLPDNLVLDGCVYIVARLKEAGTVENIGNIQTLYFGLDNFTDPRLNLLEDLFKEAGIQATLSPTISTVLWEKFIFISPTATSTSYFDNVIGELLADEEKLNTARALIEEVKQVAQAKKVAVSEDIAEKSLNKLKGMPATATSSMHSDFKAHKPANELESLTGYVLNEARKYGIETPTYARTYVSLKEKSGGRILSK